MSLNSDLTILTRSYSGEISWGIAIFFYSEQFHMKGLYPSHTTPRF